MRSALVVLTLLAAAGCGSAASGAEPDEVKRTVTLKSVCPGVHVALDALVVSDPGSRVVFLDALTRLREVAVDDTRDVLDPLIDAADGLKAVDSNDAFYLARDDVHEAVVGVNDHCVDVGSPILHEGH